MLLMKMLMVSSSESIEELRSSELVPSQSRKKMSVGTSSSCTFTCRSSGEDQIQTPLVQARVVLPTSKPFSFWISWLQRKLLPERYGPQTVTGAIWLKQAYVSLRRAGQRADGLLVQSEFVRHFLVRRVVDDLDEQ